MSFNNIQEILAIDRTWVRLASNANTGDIVAFKSYNLKST